MIAMPPTSAESSSAPGFSSSSMFELVAKGGQTFPVPLAILAAQSEPLRRATTGPWLESQQRRIDLQEWDASTVNQLVSFLYRGTYEGPESDAPLSVALLDHAKVYALAQYKDVEALRLLALRGICDGLATKEVKEIYSGAVVDLLRYVYAHTQFLANSKEPLRELVARFTATGFQRLYTFRMVELIGDADYVDFRLDVLLKICERLDGVEEKNKVLEEKLRMEKEKNEVLQLALAKSEKEKAAVKAAATKTETELRTVIRKLQGGQVRF